MSTLSTTSAKPVATTFKWCDRTGVVHEPKAMATRHLFYTLRMIWNHTMPAPAHTPGGFTLYAFGPHYTVPYLKEAIKHLAGELATRDDIQPAWLAELDRMGNWLGTRQLTATSPRSIAA